MNGIHGGNSVTMHTGGNRLYPITIQIQNQHGGWTPVQVISDSVTKDARLYWKVDDKLKFGTMEELFNSYNSEQKTYQVLSIRRKEGQKPPVNGKYSVNLDNAEVCFQNILGVTDHGVKPVYKVTFRNGKTVKVTKDHCLYGASNYGGNITAQTIEELKKVVSIDNYESVINEEICESFPYDNDMITFLGLWIADGSYQKDNTELSGIRISTGGNKKIIEWLDRFSCKFINQKSGQEGESCLKYSKSREGDVYMNRRELAEKIYDLMGDVYSESKRVPKKLFTATNQQIYAFLKGYFSGDGSIHICNDNPKNESYKYGQYYCVDCTSINKSLLEDLSVLLDRIGIKHNISSPFKPSKTGYKSSQVFYKLIIHAHPSVEKFIKNIGLIKDFEYIPRESYKRDKKLRPVSLKQVRSIEYIGEEQVFDIVGVEETEKFVVNGVLVSNTGNEISIMKREVADSLGLHLNNGEHFKVAGINGEGREFRRFKLWVKIGSLHAIQITVGFAVKHGDLAENLLGNADVLKSGKFEVTYNKDSVTYTQKALSARVSSASSHYETQQTMNNLYDHLKPQKYRVKPAKRDGGSKNSVSAYGVLY
jgi:intein/homing endonuclease